MTQLFPIPSVGARKLVRGRRLDLVAGYWVKTIVLRLVACLLLLAAPALAEAQEKAPFPLPRPADRIPEGWSPAASAAEEAPGDVAAIPEVPAVAPVPADNATNAAAAAAAVALDPQPVTLTAQITEDLALIHH